MADQGPDYETEDEVGDWLAVYAAGVGAKWVGVAIETDEGRACAAFGLPRLRALIAELTRRAALLAGEAGEAPAGAYRVTLTQGQYDAVCGILLGSKVAMPGLWTPKAQAALEAIRDAPTGEAPARTAREPRRGQGAGAEGRVTDTLSHRDHMAALVWAAAFAQSAISGSDGAVCAEIADDVEARYRAEDAARWERREREDGGQ